ncbi:MAG: AAA family ATPase [Candidatus Latescibacteria bacterium]|jgi:chromosome partitioning protein|nr:AAA family ATPase [Candidatus Latescibacterota bacterium]
MKDGLYNIGEFASLLGVSKAVIYKWEKEGKINKAKRIDRGKTMYRYYTTDDIRDVRLKMNLQAPTVNKRKQLFLNFKGGTGKSVISANYGYRLGQHGFKVLMVDLDPQGHLTKCIGENPESFSKTLFDVIINKDPIQSVISSTKVSTIDLIPANLGLSPIELSLTGLHAREFKLKRALADIEDDYDVIVLDAPPNIGLLNLNAILSVDDILVPVLADFLSYDGLKILFETLRDIEDDFDYRLENIYIFLNRYNESMKISIRSRDAIKKNYPDYVCDTVIRQNTTLSDATAQGVSIFEYAPNSRASGDINKLVNEIYNL